MRKLNLESQVFETLLTFGRSVRDNCRVIQLHKVLSQLCVLSRTLKEDKGQNLWKNQGLTGLTQNIALDIGTIGYIAGNFLHHHIVLYKSKSVKKVVA